MSMLAERRKKQKWVLLPKRAPDKPLWTTETQGLKFGQKLMEKMGWSAGKGLGAKEQGMQEPLRVSYKNDTKGMGYKLNDDEWIEQQEEFNDFLNQLNGKINSTSEKVSEPHETQIKSLEEKSKKSKSRVHYQKFTRGKDLSHYSENDLACILGTNKPKLKIDTVEQKSNETSTSNEIFKSDKEATFGVKTIHGGSLVDYFSNKWAKLKKNRNKETTKDCEKSYCVENAEKNNDENECIERHTRKRKHTASNHEIESQLNSEINESGNERSKKKKKKEKFENHSEVSEFSVDKSNAEKLNGNSKKTDDDCDKENVKCLNEHVTAKTVIQEIDNSSTFPFVECSTNIKKKKSEKLRKNEGVVNACKPEKPNKIEVEDSNNVTEHALDFADCTELVNRRQKKRKANDEILEVLNENVEDSSKLEKEKPNKGSEESRKKKKKKKEKEKCEKNMVYLSDNDLNSAYNNENSEFKDTNSFHSKENDDVSYRKEEKKEKSQKRLKHNETNSSTFDKDTAPLNTSNEGTVEAIEMKQTDEVLKHRKKRKKHKKIENKNDNDDKKSTQESEQSMESSQSNVGEAKEVLKKKVNEKDKKKKKPNTSNKEKLEEEPCDLNESKSNDSVSQNKSKKKKQEKMHESIEEHNCDKVEELNKEEKDFVETKKSKKHKKEKTEDVALSSSNKKDEKQKKNVEKTPKEAEDRDAVSSSKKIEESQTNNIIHTHKALVFRKKNPSLIGNITNERVLNLYYGAEINEFKGSNLAHLEGYGKLLKQSNPIPTR